MLGTPLAVALTPSSPELGLSIKSTGFSIGIVPENSEDLSSRLHHEPIELGGERDVGLMSSAYRNNSNISFWKDSHANDSAVARKR